MQHPYKQPSTNPSNGVNFSQYPQNNPHAFKRFETSPEFGGNYQTHFSHAYHPNLTNHNHPTTTSVSYHSQNWQNPSQQASLSREQQMTWKPNHSPEMQGQNFYHARNEEQKRQM